jgi:hypothetical protein
MRRLAGQQSLTANVASEVRDQRVQSEAYGRELQQDLENDRDEQTVSFLCVLSFMWGYMLILLRYEG